MIGLILNVRGLGNPGRRAQLRELVSSKRVDFVCLQETIKSSFSNKELNQLGGLRDFGWHWTPADGHSGGLLMGINQESCSIQNKDQGSFSLAW